MLSVEPPVWLVIFHKRSTWWVERVCPGPFKHVSAVAKVPGAPVWLHLSWELGRFRVEAVPDDGFEGWLSAYLEAVGGGRVLKVDGPDFDFGPWRPRLGTCTSMVAHLLGVRGGALLPSALWRLLVANGAEIVNDGRHLSAQDPAGTAERDGAVSGGERRDRAA